MSYHPIINLISHNTLDGWFKIHDGTWDPTTKWCNDNLIKNKGVLRVTIPAEIQAGSYLLRTEILALHEGDHVGGAQFYVFW